MTQDEYNSASDASLGILVPAFRPFAPMKNRGRLNTRPTLRNVRPAMVVAHDKEKRALPARKDEQGGYTCNDVILSLAWPAPQLFQSCRHSQRMHSK